MNQPWRNRCGAVASLVLVCIAAAPGCSSTERPKEVQQQAKKSKCQALRQPVRGRITRDTRWCKDVVVVDHVLVAKGATLSIDPGTRIRFRAYRGYKSPEKWIRMRVEGKLLARGTAKQMIRFTTADPAPVNGDWAALELVGAEGSEMSYTIIEFAQHGLNISDTTMTLSHVVSRYHNYEGVYINQYSKVVMQSCRIYGSGYNCVDVDQGTELVMDYCYVGACGTVGVHADSAKLLMEGNLVEGSQEGLYLDNGARAELNANRFAGQKNAAVSCGPGKNLLKLGKNTFDGLPRKLSVACPKDQLAQSSSTAEPADVLNTSTREGVGGFLDFIPGDQRHDPFLYALPDEDETRVVQRKIGKGLGLTWSLAWDGKELWTANMEGRVMRLNPDNGDVLLSFDAPGPQPWGMAFGEDLLWISDFVERQIYAVEPADGKVMRKFRCPDPQSGCRGLAHDGEHLWALGWATPSLYKLSSKGEVLASVPAPFIPMGDSGIRAYAAGGLTWDGEAFWAPGDRLLRFDKQGKLLGWIRGTSFRCWDLTWDGEALWTTQRTNENWKDFPRIYRVKPKKIITGKGP